MNESTRQEIKVSIAALGILAATAMPALGILAATAMPVVGWGVWTWSNVNVLAGRVGRCESDLRELDRTVAGLIVEANSNTIHRITHDKEAVEWKRRIMANEERGDVFESRLDKIESHR